MGKAPPKVTHIQQQFPHLTFAGSNSPKNITFFLRCQ